MGDIEYVDVELFSPREKFVHRTAIYRMDVAVAVPVPTAAPTSDPSAPSLRSCVGDASGHRDRGPGPARPAIVCSSPPPPNGSLDSPRPTTPGACNKNSSGYAATRWWSSTYGSGAVGSGLGVNYTLRERPPAGLLRASGTALGVDGVMAASSHLEWTSPGGRG